MAGSFITDAVVVVLVLGFMIFVHELGHFLAAKFFGVRVLVFSLGFGKRLLHLTGGIPITGSAPFLLVGM